MSIYKKFGILFVSYIFLAWFMFQPLTEVFRYKPYFTMPDETYEITHKELNAFLSVYSDMMQSTFKEHFNAKSMKSEIPASFQKWLRLHYWNIDRFFYVEQRIRDLLEYIEVRRQLEDNKKIAKSSNINLNSMNDDLEKTLYAHNYNEKELELIEANLYQITEILAGRAILGN